MPPITSFPHWKNYLSPRFLAGKVRENGILWCAHAAWIKIRSRINLSTRPIRAKFWSVPDNIRYRGKKQYDVLYAFYDLAVSPATFDIVKFLLLAELEQKRAACDLLHVVIAPGLAEGFREGKIEAYHRAGAVDYDIDSLRWRLRNILVPCCWQIPSCREVTVCMSREEAQTFQASLVKYVFPKGYTVRFPKANYDERYILEATSKGAILPSIQATPQACRFVSDWIHLKAGKRKVITITLRECSWHLDRNSNLNEWGAFARSLDPNIYCPVLLRDTEAAFKPLPSELNGLLVFPEASWNIELRVALYELSYLNMFTNSGPSTLCRLDRQARSITFKLITSTFDEEYIRYSWGIEPGSQLEFQTPFQRLVWEDDRLEVIKNAFREMCNKIERSSIEKRQK